MKTPNYSVRVPRALQRDALPPALQPYVTEYFEPVITVLDGESADILVSATTDPVLNASLSNPLTILLDEGFVLPPVTIAGPQPLAFYGEAAGEARSFCVRFRPYGPLVLLGVEAYRENGETSRPLHEMVRPGLAEAAQAWSEALLKASSFDERVRLTNEFLLTHRSEPNYRARMVRDAVEAINASGGNIRMTSLADRLGVSTRTLRRHFQLLGMPPKHFAAVVRFRRAHAYLHVTPGATWTDAIGRFGYSDQAHFARDYRRFSGTSPTRWDPDRRAVDLEMGIEKGIGP